MKTKKLLVAAFIVMALLLVASCRIPDYQLEWEIFSFTPESSYVDVTYILTNVGYEKLYDTSILLVADIALSDTDNEVWTPPIDLNVGSETTQHIKIYTSGTAEDVFVGGARWDVDDSAF